MVITKIPPHQKSDEKVFIFGVNSREPLESPPAAAEESVPDGFTHSSILTWVGDTGCDLQLTAPPGVLRAAAARETWHRKREQLSLICPCRPTFKLSIGCKKCNNSAVLHPTSRGQTGAGASVAAGLCPAGVWVQDTAQLQLGQAHHLGVTRALILQRQLVVVEHHRVQTALKPLQNPWFLLRDHQTPRGRVLDLRREDRR